MRSSIAHNGLCKLSKFYGLKELNIMKQKKVERIINEAIGFIHLMSDDTVSNKEGKRVIKQLQRVK